MFNQTVPFLGHSNCSRCPNLTLLHSEWPNLHRVLAFLSAVGLKNFDGMFCKEFFTFSSEEIGEIKNITCILVGKLTNLVNCVLRTPFIVTF